MKLQAILTSGEGSISQAAHKAIQSRGHTAKAAAHRYERRKVREFLRWGADLTDLEPRLQRIG